MGIGASHLAATFGTFATGFDTLIHVTHFFTTPGTGITDLSADFTELVA